MGSNAQKTPIARTLNEFAEQKALSVMARLGRSLPASVVRRQGGIVTVKFELTATPYTLPNVTMPMIGSEYVRLPIQPGCLGWVIPADAYLGGVSGLGGGTATLAPVANLSALVWSPLGNKNWSASEDDDALVLYGPDGTIIRSQDSTAVLKVTKADCSVTPPAGNPFTVHGDLIVTGALIAQGNLELSGTVQGAGGAQYGGSISTSGSIIAGVGTGDQVTLQHHTHGGVTTGSGTSGTPTPGT